jgi:hypothetical protein
LAVAVAAAHSPATAADNDEPPATVRELLAACDSSDPAIKKQQCDDRLFAAMLTTYDSAENDLKARWCTLPEGPAAFRSFGPAVIAWLRAHPEAQSLSPHDGEQKAAKSLYACKTEAAHLPPRQ